MKCFALFVVDGIIHLVTHFPIRRILVRDHRMITADGIKMFVFDTSRVRRFRVGVIDRRDALIIRRLNDLLLESQSTPIVGPKLVLKQPIQRPRVDDAVADGLEMRLIA